MNKYTYTAMSSQGKWFIRRTRYENLCIFYEYFTGYSFMGCANWTDSILSKCILEMDKEEAEQIIKDLEAADDPAETEAPDQDQVRIVIEAAQNWLDHLNYRGICDDALWNAIKAMKAEI